MEDKLKEQLISLGITAETEEEARKVLLQFLKQNGVTGVDKDPMTELIDYARAFYKGTPLSEIVTLGAEEKKNPEAVSEAELDQLAKEVTKGAKVEEQKRGKKTTEKPPKEEKAPKVKAEKPPKADKPAKADSDGIRGRKVSKRDLDTEGNEEDFARMKPLLDLYPESKGFTYKKVKGGVSVALKKDNSSQTIWRYNMGKVDLQTGQVEGLLEIPKFANLEEFKAVLPEELHNLKMYQYKPGSYIFVNKVSLAQATVICNPETQMVKTICESITRSDKRLGKNRAKMEETVNAE